MAQPAAYPQPPRSLVRLDGRRWRLISMTVLVAMALLSGSVSQRLARLIGQQQEAGSLIGRQQTAQQHAGQGSGSTAAADAAIAENRLSFDPAAASAAPAGDSRSPGLPASSPGLIRRSRPFPA